MKDTAQQRALRAELRKALQPNGPPKCACGNKRFWELGCRPGSVMCTDCGTVRAYTSGTLLFKTKIPLVHWKDLFDHFAQGLPIPTCRAAADHYDIAVSSAWHMIQRVLLTLALVRPRKTGDVETLMLYLRARRPMRPLTDFAPAPIRALDARLADRAVRPMPLVPASVLLTPASAHCGSVGVVHPDPFGPLSEDEIDLLAFLRRVLNGKRKVSLRWMSRWIAGWTAIWSVHRRPTAPWVVPFGAGIPAWLILGGKARPAWTSFVARNPCHVPRHALDPWLRPTG